jgi:RNA polymerase sigma-70 factor, ECF subfamily
MTDISVQSTTAVNDARDETVRLAVSGDEAAFHVLVSEYHPSMSRVAFVICGNSETARDAVQTAWGLAWRRLGGLRDPRQIQSWLIAIAANEARQAVRRQRMRPVVDISDSMERLADFDPRDTAELIDLQRALSRLNPDDRQLLALRFVAGFDSSEIAKQIGGSPSGVRSRLARLVERLRKDLTNA